MKSTSNQKGWIILTVVLGAVLILLIGFLVGRTFVAGEGTDSLDLGVDEPRNPPATGAVAVQTFSLEPGRIQAGECTTLSWTVTNAEIVTLSRDGKVIYDSRMVDSLQDCLDQTD